MQQVFENADMRCTSKRICRARGGCKEAYGGTSDLFANIKLAIKGQIHLSEKDCALLTYWVYSTWLHVAPLLASGFAITGRAHEASVVLCALQSLR